MACASASVGEPKLGMRQLRCIRSCVLPAQAGLMLCVDLSIATMKRCSTASWPQAAMLLRPIVFVCLSCCHWCHVACAGAEGAVSMKRLIAHMRKQRIGMVQTVQQYVFIYQALYDEMREAFSNGSAAPQPSRIPSQSRVARSLSVASSTSQG